MPRIAFAIACGLLWGGAVTALDAIAQPIDGLAAPMLAELLLAIGWTWMFCGIWWALAGMILEQLEMRWLLVAVPPLALTVSLLHLATWHYGLHFSLNGGVIALLGESPPADAIFFHALWINLFFGGLYLIGFAGSRRIWRARSVLRELSASRAEAEAERQHSQLGALRGQMQPRILIEAIAALHTAYISVPARAEILFQQLVDFLRAAMPGVRGGQPMLAAELDLVEAYVALRRQLDDGSGATIDLERHRTPLGLLFPPLCLLPVVDELVRAMPASARLDIVARGGPRDFILRLSGSEVDGARPLAPATERRLRLGLAALYGHRALLVQTRAGRSLTIEIRLACHRHEPSTPFPIEQRTVA